MVDWCVLLSPLNETDIVNITLGPIITASSAKWAVLLKSGGIKRILLMSNLKKKILLIGSQLRKHFMYLPTGNFTSMIFFMR